MGALESSERTIIDFKYNGYSIECNIVIKWTDYLLLIKVVLISKSEFNW